MKNLDTFYQPGAALGGNNAKIGTLLTPLINDAIIIIAIISFVMLVLAGYNFVISNGDKAKVDSATSMINYSITGLVLAVAAFVITQMVGQVGGIKDILNLK